MPTKSVEDWSHIYSMSDSELNLHYDTDTISLTSTIESDNDGIYEIRCILSEGDGRDEKGGKVTKYLIEWEGYPMHSCTWEPEPGLIDTGLLRPWQRHKELMGQKGFETFIAMNEARFNRARTKFLLAKTIRMAKRDKRRKKLTKHSRPVVEPSEDEEDTSSAQQKRLGRPSTRKLTEEAQPKTKEPIEKVSADSQDPNPLSPTARSENNQDGLFFEEPPAARKAPFEQSPSGDEHDTPSSDDSDNSLIGDSEAKGRKSSKEARAAKDPNLGNSILSRKSPRERAEVFLAKPPPTLSAADAQHQDEPSKPSREASAPAISSSGTGANKKTVQTTGPPAQATSTASRRKSTGSFAALQVPADKAADVPPKSGKSTSSVIASEPPKTNASTAIRKTGTNSKISAPIKMTNAPKPAPREWKNSEKAFQTLKYRHRADVRSRTEGTPDPSALQFVGSVPIGLVLPRSLTKRIDDPYARREVVNRRMQEIEVEHSPQQSVNVEDGPLQPHEVDKVPLVCYHWRLSNNCQYSDQKCRFMHRNTGQDGRDLPVATQPGFVPAKYRKPPLTCPFWLYNSQGCHKPDDVCQFAHRNTGWKPKDKEHLNEAVQIDSNLLPVKERVIRRPSHPETIGPLVNRKIKPSKLTCWYWTKGKCHKAPEDCAFQHYNTGIVADPPPGSVCKLYLEGHCPRTADQCKFEHPGARDRTGPFGVAFDLSISQPLQDLRNYKEGRDTAHDHAQDHSLAADMAMGDAHSQHSTKWHQPQSPIEQHQVFPPPPPSAFNPDEQAPTPPTPPAPPLTIIPPPNASCEEVKLILEQALKVNMTELFKWGEDSNGIIMLDRRAMLFYHPVDHFEELELVTRLLLMYNVEVSSAWQDGCWEYFRQEIAKGGTGVIIAHPDFEYYSELPDFGNLLQQDVRLWSLGVQEGIEYDAALSEGAPKMRHDCIEIFPVGGFIYITDEVFEENPQLALKIVQLFFAKIEKLLQFAGPVSPWQEVNDAPLLWRLAVRPELMDHIFQRCGNLAVELAARDPDAIARASLYTLLSETNYIEQDASVEPLSAIDDKFPIMSERRIIAEELPVDYFNTLERSQEEANLSMIRYYAGLQMAMRRDYRHYFVVHTKPFATCVRDWKQEIQTIAEVISPEQCVVELSKDGSKAGEEQMFDFYENYMEVKPAADAPTNQVG